MRGVPSLLMTTRVLKPPSLPLEALHGKELDGGGEGKAVAMCMSFPHRDHAELQYVPIWCQDLTMLKIGSLVRGTSTLRWEVALRLYCFLNIICECFQQCFHNVFSNVWSNRFSNRFSNHLEQGARVAKYRRM